MITIEVDSHYDAMILIALHDAMRIGDYDEQCDPADMIAGFCRALSFVSPLSLLKGLEVARGVKSIDEAERILSVLRGRVRDVEKYLEAQP